MNITVKCICCNGALDMIDLYHTGVFRCTYLNCKNEVRLKVEY